VTIDKLKKNLPKFSKQGSLDWENAVKSDRALNIFFQNERSFHKPVLLLIYTNIV